MLAQEQALAEEVLEVLLVDPDFLVAEYASAALEADFPGGRFGTGPVLAGLEG